MAAVARTSEGVVSNLHRSVVDDDGRTIYTVRNKKRHSTRLYLVSSDDPTEDYLIKSFLALLAITGKAPEERRDIVKRLVTEAGFADLLAREATVSPEVERRKLIAMLTDGPDFSEQPPARWTDRKDRRETPPEFIRREYAPWLGQGLMQAHIRRHDRKLYEALAGYQQQVGRLPPEFGLPTRKELTNRVLAGEMPLDEPTMVGASRWQERMRTRRRRAEAQDRSV